MNHTKEFLEKCHAKATELHLMKKTVYDMVGKGFMHETTFYRIWNSQQEEPRIELELALRLQSALGLSFSDSALQNMVEQSQDPIISPLLNAANDDVARNTGELLNKRREEFERLEKECARLNDLLSEKERALDEERADNLRRIDTLLYDIRECHRIMAASLDRNTDIYQHIASDLKELSQDIKTMLHSQ